MFGKFLRSYVMGFVGVTHVIRSERNMRIHVATASAVVQVILHLPPSR